MAMKGGGRPDLAIVDLALSQASGELSSGRAIDAMIPTIIVAEALTPDLMRDSFRRKPGYLPPVVDLISVDEGTEEVLKSLRRALTPRVFLAHGHDLAARDEVVGFLKSLNLRPVVLSDHAEAGQTILEKFEDFSDVAFAVILLTPDDIGGGNFGEMRPRARQNIIFELGYFFGKLGRRRVVALYKKKEGELEMPTDYSGIMYIDMDSAGNWKMPLVVEMRVAGFDIDFTQVLRA